MSVDEGDTKAWYDSNMYENKTSDNLTMQAVGIESMARPESDVDRSFIGTAQSNSITTDINYSQRMRATVVREELQASTVPSQSPTTFYENSTFLSYVNIFFILAAAYAAIVVLLYTFFCIQRQVFGQAPEKVLVAEKVSKVEDSMGAYDEDDAEEDIEIGKKKKKKKEKKKTKPNRNQNLEDDGGYDEIGDEEVEGGEYFELERARSPRGGRMIMADRYYDDLDDDGGYDDEYDNGWIGSPMSNNGRPRLGRTDGGYFDVRDDRGGRDRPAPLVRSLSRGGGGPPRSLNGSNASSQYDSTGSRMSRGGDRASRFDRQSAADRQSMADRQSRAGGGGMQGFGRKDSTRQSRNERSFIASPTRSYAAMERGPSPARRAVRRGSVMTNY